MAPEIECFLMKDVWINKISKNETDKLRADVLERIKQSHDPLIYQKLMEKAGGDVRL